LLANYIGDELTAGKAVTFCSRATMPAGSPLAQSHCWQIDSVVRDSAGNVSSITMRNPWGPAGPNNYITITPQQALDGFEAIVSAYV
jgi:hypothetical protein